MEWLCSNKTLFIKKQYMIEFSPRLQFTNTWLKNDMESNFWWLSSQPQPTEYLIKLWGNRKLRVIENTSDNKFQKYLDYKE